MLMLVMRLNLFMRYVFGVVKKQSLFDLIMPLFNHQHRYYIIALILLVLLI